MLNNFLNGFLKKISVPKPSLNLISLVKDKVVFLLLCSLCAFFLNCIEEGFEIDRSEGNEPDGQESNPPSAPTNLEVVEVGDSRITLSWVSVETAVSYVIYRNSELINEEVTETTYEARDLTNGLEYTFEVSAKNANGEGPKSEAVKVTPLPESPSAPSRISLTSNGVTQIELEWSVVNGATHYKIYRNGVLIQPNITSTTYTDTGLTIGESYTYQVVAVIDVEECDKCKLESSKSDPETIIPVPEQPSAPENLRSTVTSNTSITLAWDPVNNANYYKLYRDNSPIGGNIMNTNYMDIGLTEGKTYTYEVSAVIDAGNCPICKIEGPRAKSFSVSAIEEIEGAPKNFSVSAGDQQVTLSWNAISGASYYRVFRDGGSSPIVDNLAATTYTDQGLNNGTEYSYTVTAVNSLGIEGPQTSPVTATPLPGKPSTPDSATITITRGNQELVLNWNAVNEATHYRVYVGNTNTQQGNDIAAPTTTYTVTGLTNGTEYTYTITAVIDVGNCSVCKVESNRSRLITSTPLPDRPVAPLVTVVPGDSKIILSWAAVSGANYYRVFRDGGSNPIIDNLAETTYTDEGLTNGIPVNYELVAVTQVEGCARPICTLISDRSDRVTGTPGNISLNSLVSGTKIDPMKYVNTLIATGSTISVSGRAIGGNNETNNPEGAHYPFGMTTFTPLNSLNTYSDGDSRWGAADRWTHYASRKHRVKGFAVTDLNGPGCDAAGDFPIMMHPGHIKNKNIYFSDSDDRVLPLYIKGTNIPNTRKGGRNDNSGTYPSSNVIGEAGYYKVIFENDMIAELTVSKRSGIAKFTFPASISESTLFFTTGSRMTRNRTTITASSNLSGSANVKAIQAQISNEGFCANNASAYTIYMYAEFDKNSSGNFQMKQELFKQYKQLGYEFDLNSVGRTIHVKFGISYVNYAGAYNNLIKEIPGFDFTKVKNDTQTAWKNLLSRVQVYTNDETSLTDKLTLFYSGLYRSFHAPTIFSDVDCQYRGFNNSIYTIPNQTRDGVKICDMTQYQNFSGWDTYRSQSQLIALIDRKIASDMAQSLINNSKQANCSANTDVDRGNCVGGSLTRWGIANDDAGTMAGEPGAIIVANTLAFGATDFKFDEALDSMQRGQEGKRSDNTQLGSSSYTPHRNHENKRLRSSELELASAYFAKAAFAKRLAAISSDANYRQRYSVPVASVSQMKSYYNQRAMNYFTANIDKFKISTGETVNGITADNGWQEGNIHQYKWMYPPNVAKGSLSILSKYFSGTTSQAVTELDNHVRILNSGHGNSDTGLFFGNEPGHFTPLVYNFLPGGSENSQAPNSYKSQKVIGRIQKDLYKNAIDLALPGNEDLGAMAAWYAWTAMGLYPSIPGLGFYNLTSPLFDYILIEKNDNGGNGLILIKALNSKDRRHISNITLNNQSHLKTYITFKKLYQDLDNTTLINENGIDKKVTILNFTLVRDENNANKTLTVSPSFQSLSDIDDYL